MSFTRAVLRTMDENELRTQVLIPLFKAMGFRDVIHFHGGVLEQGKDIVMWKSDDFRDRVNFGVVAKASRISGKAAGNSSAAEVCFQIEQTFNTPYPDSVSLEEQRIHRCLVVSSKEITKEAQNAIKGILKKNSWDIVTEFIDGDRLWDEFIERFLPQRAVLEKLEQVDKTLGQASSAYRINSRTSAEGIELSIVPRSPESLQEEPLLFNFDLTLPSTSEGLQMRKALEQHFATGTPITIEKPFIQSVSLPDFMKPFMPLDCKMEKIVMGSVRSTRTFSANIEVETPDGERAALDFIQFKAVQVGSEEMTLTNEEQSLPWKVKMTLNVKKGEANFALNTDFNGVNVERVLRALYFGRAIAKGGTLRVRDLDTQLEPLSSPVVGGNFKAPDPRWVRQVEDLVFIQRKVQVPISLPEHDLSIEEIRVIKSLAGKIRTGRAIFTFSNLTVSLPKDGAQRILRVAETGEPVPLRLEQDETQELFGIMIPLGKAIYTCEKALVSSEERDRLKSELDSAAPDSVISIQMQPFENCQMHAEYPKWKVDTDPDIRG